MNLAPGKRMFTNVLYQPEIISKKFLSRFLNKKVQDIIGDVHRPTCENEKYGYTSFNQYIV